MTQYYSYVEGSLNSTLYSGGRVFFAEIGDQYDDTGYENIEFTIGGITHLAALIEELMEMRDKYLYKGRTENER